MSLSPFLFSPPFCCHKGRILWLRGPRYKAFRSSYWRCTKKAMFSQCHAFSIPQADKHGERIGKRFDDDAKWIFRTTQQPGLSIARRMLRDLGEDLILEPSTIGCCFVALIPQQSGVMGDMDLGRDALADG